MTGDQFIRNARKWAKAHGRELIVKSDEGKGSHRKVYLGEHWTTVKHGEISKPLLVAMLKQLGIPRDQF